MSGKRATKEERTFWAQMVMDARIICWKLQNNQPLNEAEQKALASMPLDVQQAIREVGES